MRRRAHIELLVLASLVWVGFLIGGMPSYYQQYSTATMAPFGLAALVPISGVVYVVLRGVKRERRRKVSAWIAFCFTVALAIYDWLYCGVYLGCGMGFLSRVRYPSVYYAIPWIVLPAVAVIVDHRESGGSRNAVGS